MSAPKFTPGPWLIERYSDKDSDTWLSGPAGSDPLAIDGRLGVIRLDPGRPATEANAALIAAAPEMFEALVEAETCAVRAGWADAPRFGEALKQIRRVLAKARGER